MRMIGVMAVLQWMSAVEGRARMKALTVGVILVRLMMRMMERVLSRDEGSAANVAGLEAVLS